MKISKCLALAVAGVMSTSMVACGNSGDGGSGSSGGNKTITVLTNRTDMNDKFDEYAKEFESQNPGVTVKFENLTDYEGMISQRLAAKEVGDVLFIPANNMTKDQYPSYFESLGTSADLSAKYDYTDEATVDDQVYGLAVGGGAQGIVYNAKVFKDAGIEEKDLPKTPEEWVKTLKTIKEKCPDVIPYYSNYKDGWCLQQWTDGLALSVSGDPDYGNKRVDDKNEFKKGSAMYTDLKLLYDATLKADGLSEDAPMSTDWEKSKTDMATGKIGAMCLGSWAVGQIRDKAKEAGEDPENIRFMAAPVTHADGKQTMQLGPDYKIGVSKESENKEEAKKFVEFFLTKYAQDSNMISPVKGSPAPDFVANPDNINFVIANAGTPETSAKWGEIQKEFGWGDAAWIQKVVDIAQGKESKSFDDYMNELNEKYAKAVDAAAAAQ